MAPSQPKAFTLFPQLPLELRLKIWSLISPGPRTVTIKYTMFSPSSARKNLGVVSAWKSPDPIPTILHVCHESRTEALKSYQLAFGCPSGPGRTYFDFSKDRLRFGNPQQGALDIDLREDGPVDYMLDIFLGGDFYGADDAEKVRYMVTDVDESVYGRRAFLWDEIRLFSGLKELTIVPWDEYEMKDELMRFYRDKLGNVARAHPEWVVPRIVVISATGALWGTLQVEDRD